MNGSGEPRDLGNRVYVVDDDDGLRDATCFSLKVAGFEVTGFPSAPAFLEAVDPFAGGCAVLDVNMPQMTGLELQQELNQLGSNIAVVFVTGYGDVPTAVTAVRAGAVDFLEKPYKPDLLISAVERALSIDVCRPSPVIDSRAKAAIAALTAREREVLRGLTRGLSNKAIAKELELSPRTVEMHRANMMAHLGVSSLSEALRIAYDAGFASDRRRTDRGPRVGGRRASDRPN